MTTPDATAMLSCGVASDAKLAQGNLADAPSLDVQIAGLEKQAQEAGGQS